jgi:plastocyanin
MRTPTHRILVAAGLLAVLGAAAAATLTVTQRTDTVNLFAERVTLKDQFALGTSTIAPAPAALAAVGTSGSPAALASPFAVARTAITQDDWVYAADVSENAPGSVSSGTYSATLTVDGNAAGTIYLIAGSSSNQTEGVHASFDVGSALSPDALYAITVKPVLGTGPTVTFSLKSNPNGNLTWLGVGTPIDGETNPQLSIASGSLLQLTVTDGDGNTHAVGIRDGNGNLLDPPGNTPNIQATGDQQTLTWTAVAGTYTYKCPYHASMVGTLVVT